ncbi:hypothetical protein FYC62_14835 [Pedobacter aquae]|uniref:Uncharacterized protein n=1 Tax=Pedobacter aquae TaxID=2605747 RepID=A0A5C0VJV9_9SPHI|nr:MULTISPECIES: hypothetical protein [Pedobacter]QEK52796.1 hypothetical protein FYC62_14835 [Pedobacter aquae]
MKKVALVLGLFTLSFGALAQDKSEVKQSDLKGPAYKNYKFWMHKSVPTKIQSASTVNTLQGPAYKNQNFSANTSNTEMVLVSTVGNEQQNLKGPAYKNYNHFSRKSN